MQEVEERIRWSGCGIRRKVKDNALPKDLDINFDLFFPNGRLRAML